MAYCLLHVSASCPLRFVNIYLQVFFKMYGVGGCIPLASRSDGSLVCSISEHVYPDSPDMAERFGLRPEQKLPSMDHRTLVTMKANNPHLAVRARGRAAIYGFASRSQGAHPSIFEK